MVDAAQQPAPFGAQPGLDLVGSLGDPLVTPAAETP